jgi:hypothetical protein
LPKIALIAMCLKAVHHHRSCIGSHPQIYTA